MLLLTASGCGLIPPPPAKHSAENEPNDDFGQAQPVNWDGSTSIEIAAVLADQNDCDVFDLGMLEGSTMVSAHVRCADYVGEEVIAAVFNDAGEIVRLSDELICKRREATLLSQQIVEQGQYYLAIAFVDTHSAGPMSYDLRIELNTAQTPYQQVSQVVYLDFDGENDVWLDTDHWATLTPLSDAFGVVRAETIADTVLQAVRNDYDGLNIDIVSSYHAPPPPSDVTIVYITGTADDLYGLAESVDWYNHNPNDTGIVFASSFDHQDWSDNQIATAIANVTSHELGHLLGLVHTDDDNEIMDEATPDICGGALCFRVQSTCHPLVS